MLAMLKGQVRALLVCLSFTSGSMLFSPAAHAQTHTNGRLTVRRIASLPDSIIDYARSPLVRFARRTDGAIAVASLPENLRAVVVSKNLQSVAPLMRRGHGPGEADSPVMAVSVGAGDLAMITSLDPPKGILFSADGKRIAEAQGLTLPDGAAICRGEMYQSGVAREVNNDRRRAVYQLRTGKDPQKMFDIPGTAGDFSFDYNVQHMHAMNDRLLVSNSIMPTLAVSDTGCNSFRMLNVALPWFTMPQPIPAGQRVREQGPMRVVAVQWYDATRAMLLISRPIPGSKATMMGRDRAARPRFPAEYVLVLFNVADGKVLEQLVLPRVLWSFLSSRELVQHNTNPDNEWHEIYAIELKK